MGFPAFAKTWAFSVNNTTTAASTLQVLAQELICQIKNLLVTAGWTVVSSSNAGVASAVNYGTTASSDLWVISNATLTSSGGVITVSNDVNFAAAGTRHSWIVLQNNNVNTGFQLCIDCNANGAGTRCTFVFSSSAGFTGGTVTARPTATDEFVCNGTGQNIHFSEVNTTHQTHCMYSSDGQCTRIVMFRGGNNCCFWLHIDKGQNPVSGWSTPWIGTVYGATSGYANSYANLIQNSGYRMRGGGATPNFTGGMTLEATNITGALVGLPLATGIGTATNTFDSQWPVMPMGICANATGNGGRLCGVYDLWWSPGGISDADTFPNSATARSYAKLGNLVVPWTGDSTIPLIA